MVGFCLGGFLGFLLFRLYCAIRCRLGGLEVFQVLRTMFVPSDVGCWKVFVVSCLYIVENFGARLVVWFWIRTVSVVWFVWRKC